MRSTPQIFYMFRRTLAGMPLCYCWFEAMHSRMDLLIAGVENAEPLCREAAAETTRIENLISRFDPDSPVAIINADTTYGVCRADHEVLDLFAEALRLGVATDGLFDLCIQTPDYRAAEPCFMVDYAREAVVKLRPEVQFDFGGYGKGYALDRVRGVLARGGVRSALVSFGRSSIYAVGEHPSGGLWQTGVDNPMFQGQQMGLFALTDQSLTSSGNTPSVREHIRVPQTGERVGANRIVSVVTESPVEGEVLSTALFIASPTQRQELVHRFAPQRVRVMEFDAQRYEAHELV